MENKPNKIESEKVIDADLKINFSKEAEEARIRYTLKKLGWFKERGYKINLPSGVKDIVDHGGTPTDEEISRVVNTEFDPVVYEEKINDLKQKWEEEKEDFLLKLATLGLPIQTEYKISFTKYGVGGSYGLPNNIQINFDYSNARDTLAITFHEMVHLTIEDLIQEFNIDHWTKERLVDLIYAKFFPAKKRLQRNPEKTENIDEIFNRFFPDVKKIISEISKLKKEFAAKEKLVNLIDPQSQNPIQNVT